MRRRLHARLGTQCNSRCVHCTVGDIAHLAERDTAACRELLRKGREAGCVEVVFMRGEPTIRRDIIELVRDARALGYEHVQLQTNGRMLAYPKTARALIRAGVSFFEVSLYGDTEALHDGISRVAGSFLQTVKGIANLLAARAEHLITVPIIAQNYVRLPEIVTFLGARGVRWAKLNFSRPVNRDGRWRLETVARLAMVSPFVRDAYRTGASIGMDVQVEAIPFCHLEPHMHPGADATEDWSRHVIGDLHCWHDGMTALREETRGRARECQGCAHEDRCPRTWEAYLSLFGEGELARIGPGNRGRAL